MASYGLNSYIFHDLFAKETAEIVIKLYEALDANERSWIKPELALFNLVVAPRTEP